MISADADPPQWPPATQVDYIELEGRTMLPVPGHTKRVKYEFGTLTHFAYKV